MSQSTAEQTEAETAMTEREAEQLAIIEERIHLANFFKGPWLREDFPNHSLITIRKHHEPHENCAGDLILAAVTGKPVYRHAITRLIARAPSMLTLLEKALPLISQEAERREDWGERHNAVEHKYAVEMSQLRDAIMAEIDRAKGKEVKTDG
jgi:hypothetical protein